MLLEINRLIGMDEALSLKRKIAEYPQTLFAMIGSSGRSVKFVVAYTHPDGSLPRLRTDAKVFHAHAYRHTLKTYEPRLSYPIELSRPALEAGCRLSYDAELYLTRFALINIDEFDQVSDKHQGFLKHLLQKPVVNVRKPYAAQIESVKRYASFIATSNHTDLLGDPFGSRRFICIEVKG